MRVVQLQSQSRRSLAIVDEPYLHLLRDIPSLYALARDAENRRASIVSIAEGAKVAETLDYEPIYAGESPWRILPALDYPNEDSRCLVSGTGLTHTGSAKSRNSMHARTDFDTPETDSMRMFRWGVEGGKPAESSVGIAPEWFYKGDGMILRASGDDLDIPAFAESGGEESEIAGLYLVGANGSPRRIGYATGNEFSDHVFEKKNYLYLAHSKIRSCSLGPEAILGETLADNIEGQVTIFRGGKKLWESELASGELNMSHSVRNIEHHHFKYASHQRPGDVHVHFFGAAALSYSAGVLLRSGDSVHVKWNGFGRPLWNRIVAIDRESSHLVEAKPL